jgi:hypothetical protein
MKSKQRYAILICGGIDKTQNKERDLASLSLFYKGLLAFGLPKDHIQVFYGPGKILQNGQLSFSLPKNAETFLYPSLQDRMAGYLSDHQITGAAQKMTMLAQMNRFIAKIANNSELIFYITSHGNLTPHGSETVVHLWGSKVQDEMPVSELHDLLKPLDVKFVRTTIFTDICYGGGLTSLSSSSNRIVVFATQIPTDPSMGLDLSTLYVPGSKDFGPTMASRLAESANQGSLSPRTLGGPEVVENGSSVNKAYSTMFDFLARHRAEIERAYQTVPFFSPLFSYFTGLERALYPSMANSRLTASAVKKRLDRKIQQKALQWRKLRQEAHELEAAGRLLDDDWHQNKGPIGLFNAMHLRERLDLMQQANLLDIPTINFFGDRIDEYNQKIDGIARDIHLLDYEILELKLQMGGTARLRQRYEEMRRLQDEPF